MAYANAEFYKQKFFGEVLEDENIERWLSLASDELDSITFGRLIESYPTVEIHAEKVQKAVCAIAEALYCIDIQKKAVLAQKGEDGEYHGTITSISSGRESISYSQNNNTSVYALAAANFGEQVKLIHNIAYKYLAYIPDANGINLLYAGGN